MTIKERQLSRRQTILRRAVSQSLELVWPHTLEHVGRGLSRAQELLGEDVGVVVLITHPSLRDAQEVIKDIFFGQPGFWERHLSAPIAAHQYSPLLAQIAYLLGIDIHPVINEHSVREGFAPVSCQGKGVAEYIAAAARNLAAGGVVLLAPQAGREPSLYPAKLRTVEFFVRQMRRKHIDNVGYLLVGLGIAGESDYTTDRARGHNFGRTFTVKIGETFLQNEIINLSKADGLSIDHWLFRQFEPLVPTNYVGSL